MRLFFLCLIALVLGCESSPAYDTPPATPPASDTTEVAAGPVKTGAQMLAETNFAALAGKRVGLVVNHTAMVDSVHVIDLIDAAPNVDVTALFGPEHGLRGTADAGEKVDDGRDDRTGAPVYSLYGKTRKPSSEMLNDVDVLVFDIQDVGARFYTYISTMGLAMQAAAENNIPFVVLDRPNPLGGNYVSGFMLEPEQTSFVGQYPIPIAHGLTVGELARMIQGEAMLPGLDNLQLDVVSMADWQRPMLWPTTGLPWINTSPNIPDFETSLVYAGTCLFEAVAASEGRGTQTPFTLLGASWADGQALADTLNDRDLPGVRFEAATFAPRSIEGMSANPRFEGEDLQGLRIAVTDADAYRSVEAGIHVLHAFYQQAQGHTDFISNPEWLAKLSGTPRLAALLQEGASPANIIAAWEGEVAAFETRREGYLMY